MISEVFSNCDSMSLKCWECSFEAQLVQWLLMTSAMDSSPLQLIQASCKALSRINLPRIGSTYKVSKDWP